MAFCAESAKLDVGRKDFKVTGVIEIETGDKRGTIYIAVGELK